MTNRNLTQGLLGIRAVPENVESQSLSTRGAILSNLEFIKNNFVEDYAADPKGSPCIEFASDNDYKGFTLIIVDSVFEDNRGGSGAIMSLLPLDGTIINFTYFLNNTRFTRNFAYCKHPFD